MSGRHALIDAARNHSDLMEHRLGELVSCESPSGDAVALGRCADLLDGWATGTFGHPAHRMIVGGMPHLLWRAPDPVILLLGHFDTVWPLGTIQDWPFTQSGGVAAGPGVFDMKAGIVQFLTAIELVADRSKVSLLLTCDEETGSATSRALIEQEARRVRAVLVGEPSADGSAVKIARKGVACYRVSVIGRAAHAGLEPERGVNATVEVAHQVLALGTLAASKVGTTVTPTLLNAGTTANTVPESASVQVDARAWTRGELERVDDAIQQLRPVLPNASIDVTGGIDRYPLEPESALPLLAQAQAAARDAGLPVPDGVRSGGGSDGNLTSALGVATLDGLGAVGGHPHGRDEWVDVAAMAGQVARLVALIDRLCQTSVPPV